MRIRITNKANEAGGAADMTTHTDTEITLRRFLNIQAPVLGRARADLEGGRKVGQWMWFVFPQLARLGTSSMLRHYAIASREEAAAFLRHRLLGSRLRELTRTVNAVARKSAREIFGVPDDLKFHSSMTLFAMVAEPGSVFEQSLDRFFSGVRDPLTSRLLAPSAAESA